MVETEEDVAVVADVDEEERDDNLTLTRLMYKIKHKKHHTLLLLSLLVRTSQRLIWPKYR